MNDFSTLYAIVSLFAKSPRRDLCIKPFGKIFFPTFPPVCFSADIYQAGERLAISLVSPVMEGEEVLYHSPFCSVTVNVPGAPAAEGLVFVKTYGENVFLRFPLLSQGWFVDTGDRIAVGHTHVEVWRPTQKFFDAFVDAHQHEMQALESSINP